MSIDDVITMLNSEDCMLAIAGMCLMRYKERDCWKCILEEYTKTVYNKAIDDLLGGMNQITYNCQDADELFEKICDLAKLLKAGGKKNDL